MYGLVLLQCNLKQKNKSIYLCLGHLEVGMKCLVSDIKGRVRDFSEDFGLKELDFCKIGGFCRLKWMIPRVGTNGSHTLNLCCVV